MSAADGKTAPERSELAERLGEARVALRGDLEVSRHLFRGEVAYVLQDSLTFQSHRFQVADYYILSSLHVEETLAETFANLVEDGRLRAEDENRFYEFILSMHRMGFLKLPISDEKSLYRRHVAKQAGKRKSRATSALFLQVPLWNPDQFLTRTMERVRFLCTRWAFVAWCALVLTAGWVLFQQWGEFRRPVADIFSGENLPLLWLTLIGLKVAHEFGHAYSCKHFGGHVPEMGVYLILFTPCAFVDTTSAWNFTRKSQRIMVCLAGMYVELAIASIALLLWTVVEPGFARSALHNVVLLASVVTVGFNVNPLMRYDGYYALSDIVEVPNLRSRAQEYATSVLKRVTLGVPIVKSWGSRTMRFWLFVFGVASAIYKVLLVLGISMAIATKFLLGGLLLGGIYCGGELVKLVKRTIPYLWYSPEAAAMRVRAVGYSLILIAGLPLFVAGVPLPSSVRAPGVIVGGQLEVLRAEAAGFLEQMPVALGDRVEPGRIVAQLTEPEKAAELAETRARRDIARLRLDAFRATDPSSAEIENLRLRQLDSDLDFLARDLERLTVTGDRGGTVVACLSDRELGRFVKRGEEIATLADGLPLVRALLTESDLADADPQVGMQVEFRAHSDPQKVWVGTVRRIVPTGTRQLDETFLDHLDTSELALHPVTGEASRSHFEVEIALEKSALGPLSHGMTGRLWMPGRSEPLSAVLFRKLVAFVDRVKN